MRKRRREKEQFFLSGQKILPTQLRSYHVSQHTHTPDSIKKHSKTIIKLRLLGFFNFHCSHKILDSIL